jgi:hypothetical protein
MVRNHEELCSAICAAPHCVMMSASGIGLGCDLEAMIDFYWESSEAICTGHLRTRTYPRDWIYFCFSDAKNAEEFAVRFGGEILVR